MGSISTKRALIIAAPFEGLRGTLYDAHRIESALRARGFEIEPCFGPDATRAGILSAWQRLIDATTTDDAVVIYYSGHGGLVQSDANDKNSDANDIKNDTKNDTKSDTKKDTDRDVASTPGEKKNKKSDPWRYQFLVPVDYDQTTATDFRGITDIEISHLLQAVTDRTKNTTIILDCCHSGRMFRAPSVENARAKNLRQVQYHQVASHLSTLREQGHLGKGSVSLTGNPHAVRIVAAAPAETAWEYLDGQGEWGGAYTEALVRAMQETDGHSMSWRTMFLRVAQLVGAKFPTQHPRVEGPETRIPFSMERAPSRILHLRVVNGAPVLQAGNVSGVRKGNVYTVVPLNWEGEVEGELVEGTVTTVAAFKAKMKLTGMPNWSGLKSEGALAILKSEAVERKPVRVLGECEGLLMALQQSRYLEYQTGETEGKPVLGEFQVEEQAVILRNQQGVRIASQGLPAENFEPLLDSAELLARAQWARELRCARVEDQLEHSLSVDIGLVEDGEAVKPFTKDGHNEVREKSLAYITLTNDGGLTVYVSVLNINVAGCTSLITEAYSLGMELPPGRSVTLGSDEFGDLVGLEISWPEGVSREMPVQEQFLVLITDQPADPRHIEEAVNHRAPDLSTGRDMARSATVANTRYDIRHVPFSLQPLDVAETEDQGEGENATLTIIPVHDDKKVTPASDLPDIETLPGWDELPPSPPLTAGKGFFGAILRASKNIPPCVWVVNKHAEEITVVVSKYRPNRMLTGVTLDASATGAGVGFNASTWTGPATKKTLPAHGDGAGCVAVFPLWTRKEGFGVISIFRGVEQKLYIENDAIPLGATAFFVNQPNLEIVEYGS